MRTAFVTWLVASVFVSGFLATIVFYLALIGYFMAPQFEEVSLERFDFPFALACFIAGHLLPRFTVANPRCAAVTRSFVAAQSYRTPAAVVGTCTDPRGCEKRAAVAVHRRVALGVGLSLPIAVICFRVIMANPSLGGHGCMSSPMEHGGNILVYIGMAMAAVLSHAPRTARFTRRAPCPA